MNSLTKEENKKNAIYNIILTKHAHLARTHVLPKVHKHLGIFHLSDLLLIGATHYLVGKYLFELFNPLTYNRFSIKNSLDAANRINIISLKSVTLKTILLFH